MAKLPPLPALQVALDFTDLGDAARVAVAAVEGGAEIVEVGTPLLKAEGVKAVRVLRRMFPDKLLVADTKTMDTGALETALVGGAGADVVTVLGVADDETIRGAVGEARKRGMLVFVDLISHPDPVGRAEELAGMGVDIVGIHVGIDVQTGRKLTAAEQADLVRRVSRVFPGVVAVAGGLRAETVAPVVEAGAGIVIVGSAITKARDPREAARRIVEAMRR